MDIDEGAFRTFEIGEGTVQVTAGDIDPEGWNRQDCRPPVTTNVCGNYQGPLKRPERQYPGEHLGWKSVWRRDGDRSQCDRR